MKRTPRVASFARQMAQSLDELRSIMSKGQSPTADGRLTARSAQVREPSAFDARKIKNIRQALDVSQAVFARLVGVSDVLVRSWERGVRRPAPVARRLLDQISNHPDQFVKLIQPHARNVTARRKRNGKRAA